MKPGTAKVGDKISYLSYDKRKISCVITKIETYGINRLLWGFWTREGRNQDTYETHIPEENATLEGRPSWKSRIED